FWPGMLAGDRRHEHGCDTGSAALQITERGDGMRISPLKVVQEERDRRLLRYQLDQRLQRVDFRNVLSRFVDPKLGQDLAERRQALSVQLCSCQRVAKGGR